MPESTDILSADELAQIKGLQLFARRVVEGFTSGLHTSPHKGFSVEFKQHRPYVRGDEIRRVDWKAYGRSDRFYIREYEEETNLRARILLDISGSMGYVGTAGVEKLDYARKLSACLAYQMVHQQDTAGLVTFDEDIRDIIPPRSRASHLQVIFRALVRAKAGGETGLASALQTLVPRLGRRGLLILITDGFDEVAPLLKALAQLRHRGQEILMFQLWDRDELEFPFRRSTMMINLENIAEQRLIDPAILRRTYLENVRRFREELEQGARRNRIDLVPLITDQPCAAALSHYLKARLRRG